MTSQPASDLRADTLRYLEQQKRRGVRYVRLAPGQLEELETFSAPARAETPSTPAPLRISTKEMSPEKKAAFEALRTRVLACTKCEHLVRFRHNVVFGVGNVNSEIMFVGEAPGADEDEQGEPFVGKAGQLLTKMIQAMGFQRSDVYIANVLKCRPNVETAYGNRKPTPEEMATCLPYLREQIQLIQPRVIVAVGDTAVKGLLPDLKEGITRLRGKWLEYDNIPLMPTFHPSYLLRNASIATKRLCWEDLLAAMEKLGMPVSDKQRNYFLSALPNQGDRS